MARRVPARPADTTPDAERVQAALFRAASKEKRLAIAMRRSAAVISSARAGIARGTPGLSARELDLRFVEVHYGPEIAAGLRAELTRRDRAGQTGA
jgi:hypothetical protein